jgi:hypothetical protein
MLCWRGQTPPAGIACMQSELFSHPFLPPPARLYFLSCFLPGAPTPAPAIHPKSSHLLPPAPASEPVLPPPSPPPPPGTGMPLEFTTASEASCGGCACDGLLHLFRAQCDVHLAPPRRFLERTPATQQQQAGRRSMSPYPPPPVLCAFGVLLDEAGGALRDVYGEPVDYNAAADAAFFDSTTSVGGGGAKNRSGRGGTGTDGC